MDDAFAETLKILDAEFPDSARRAGGGSEKHHQPLSAVQFEVDRRRGVLDEEERLLGRLERSILERTFRGVL